MQKSIKRFTDLIKQLESINHHTATLTKKKNK
jgi:hypothetical protein